MLDLDHPMTDHIFAAARATDRLSTLAKHMTLASTQERRRLLEICQEPLQNMRQLNVGHFGNSDFIADAIDELEISLNNLAELRTEPPAGTAYAVILCPACGEALTRVHAAYMPKPEQRWSVYCNHCLGQNSPAWQKLDSHQGFGTWAI